MEMHYVYHPTLGTKCVATNEYYKLLEEGWFDTPAKFHCATPQLDEAPLPEVKAEVKKKGRPKKE